MGLVDRVHGRFHVQRRVRVLARHLAHLIPPDATVLDVGCGDGRLAHTLLACRPDLRVEGVDVLLRAETAIPVRAFDGQTLPFEPAAFDVAMAVDVLHHADDPAALLAEMTRVARRCLVLKDHTLEGLFAHATLRFMDRVGNARHGVALPYHYWTRSRWQEAFEQLGLVEEARTTDLCLYPWPASWLFDRSLHFAARLAKGRAHPRAGAGRPSVP